MKSSNRSRTRDARRSRSNARQWPGRRRWNSKRASKTGWVGPAGTTGHLHTSTIINSPDLTAESKIYHSFGATAAADTIGVRPAPVQVGRSV